MFPRLQLHTMPAPAGTRRLADFQVETIVNMVRAVAGPNPPHGINGAVATLLRFKDVHAAQDLADACARVGYVGLAAGIDTEVSE
ncbi:MAG: hypothetical protein J2P50_18375 [Hyphomicrobiaceae bacterium]|nr:hypothetical protein [Hyphomicrobiaceae bacterium]